MSHLGPPLPPLVTLVTLGPPLVTLVTLGATPSHSCHTWTTPSQYCPDHAAISRTCLRACQPACPPAFYCLPATACILLPVFFFCHTVSLSPAPLRPYLCCCSGVWPCALWDGGGGCGAEQQGGPWGAPARARTHHGLRDAGLTAGRWLNCPMLQPRAPPTWLLLLPYV